MNTYAICSITIGSIGLVGLILWLIYEIKHAPTIDNDGRQIKE